MHSLLCKRLFKYPGRIPVRLGNSASPLKKDAILRGKAGRATFTGFRSSARAYICREIDSPSPLLAYNLARLTCCACVIRHSTGLNEYRIPWESRPRSYRFGKSRNVLFRFSQPPSPAPPVFNGRCAMVKRRHVADIYYSSVGMSDFSRFTVTPLLHRAGPFDALVSHFSLLRLRGNGVSRERERERKREMPPVRPATYSVIPTNAGRDARPDATGSAESLISVEASVCLPRDAFYCRPMRPRTRRDDKRSGNGIV